MIKIIYNIISVFCLASAISCSYLKKDNDVEIRLVNLDGQSRKMNTRIPTLNLKALSDQGKLYSTTSNITTVNNLYKSQNTDIDARYIENRIPSQNLVRDTSYNNQDNFKTLEPEMKTLEDDALEDDNKQNFGDFSSQFVQNLAQKNLQNEQITEVNYDLGSDQENAEKEQNSLDEPLNMDTTKNKEKDNKLITFDSYKKEIYVQVGSFSKESNARNFLKFMKKFNKGEIQQVKTKTGIVHRVLLGPMDNPKRANDIMIQIKNAGHDAILFRK